MRMIPKQEFTEELLNKYEIAHVLSAETIDSMISRGFIPFATNEVGDKIYNIDYYLENEDVFAAKLADFKNTRGYYTDSEFKKALVERDSSFESRAVNSFNQLAQRGLIRSDDVFEVQPKRIYLFSSSLIYNLESIKAALEELNTQLEAEEIDEFSLSLDEAETEEDVSEETEESKASQPEEEEFLEEDEDREEEDDKQARRKKKRKEQEKIARERRIKEEQQRVADITKTEAVKAKERAAYRPTQTESYRPETSRSESYHSEHVEKSAKHKAEVYTSEHSDTVYTEEHKTETKQEDVRHDYHPSSSEYYSQDKAEDSRPSGDSVSKAEKYSEQKQPETVYKPQIEEEKHYLSTPERTTYQSSQEPKSESYASSEFKPETKSESYTLSSSAQQDTYAVERKREEAARAQYEAERRQAQFESKQESKPKPRREDGTFTFTGTSIGKETAPEHVETATHEEARPAEFYQASKEYHKEESSQRSKRTSEHKEKTYSSESYSAQNPESAEKYREYRTEKHEEYRPSVHEEHRPSERGSSTEQQSSHETERKTTNEQAYVSSQTETYKSSESSSEKPDSEKRTEQYDTSTGYQQSSYNTETKETTEQSYTSSQTKATESRGSYLEKSAERHESYSEKSDDGKPAEKHSDYSTPTETSYTVQEKQYKEEVEARRNQTQRKEQEAPSDYSEQKREVRKENGYEFTGTSIGKDKYNTESVASEEAKSTENSQQRPGVLTERQKSTSYRTEQKEAERGTTTELRSASETNDTDRSSASTFESRFDKASEHSLKHEESGFSDKKEQSDKSLTVAEDVEPTPPTHSEPYKINIPLADGSYMTFETHGKETQSKQSTTEQADENSQTAHKTSRGNSTNGYDNYVTRAQAAYVSQGVALSSEAINSIVAEVNSHSEGQGFKVSISRPSSDGVFKEDVVYDSQKKDSIGNIVDAYKEASRVDVLPTRTPEQEAKDNKVLFAVGLQTGGSVKDDTYIPPAVPTIHPRVFDELQQQGVKYVEVNGAKVNISDMSHISRTEFSVVENATSYVNETVAKEQIAQATQFKYTPKIDIQQRNPAISYVKDAEKIVVAAADTRASFNSTFFIDSIKSAPEFVPAYLREVYTRETPKQEPKPGDDVKMKTINGFSSVRNLGSASDLRPNQSQSEYNGTTGGSFAAVVMPTMFRERKGSSDAAQRQADARQIGVATAVLDFSSVNIDFTKPETVEECARVVEEFQPELAKSLRATSKAINGDIASVLAGEADKVDGARLINRPETFIVGKAEYAEQIAAAIEDRYPENAARIRELSEQLNSPTSQLDTRKDIFRQFDINGKTSEEMAIKAQELLQDPHSFKGRAREIEQIASVVEGTRGDIAKQLRQASRAQNGDIADVYTRAIRFERQINNPVPIANGQYQGKNNPQGKTPMGKNPSQGSFDPTGRAAVIKPGVNPDIKKHHRFGKLTSENIHATSKMTSLESRDEHGRKIIDVIEDNGDGTFNITHGYNTRNAVTVYGWTEGIESFGTSAIESAAMKKTKLARIATRNRKLIGAQFMTSKNAHFALNNSWVKTERKQHKVKHGEVNNMDNFTREIAQSTHMMYQQYQSGYNHPETWEELFDRHGFSGDGSVVRGLRGSELLKKQRQDALPDIASNILMRAMPTQELNSTYLGTGYKYLLGRGSALWTMNNIGAALNARDEVRNLNRKMLTNELGTAEFSFAGKGIKYNFRSGKDRRALTKQLSAASKASMGVNITRFTTTSLNKMLRTRKDEAGNALSEKQLEMVQTALKIRGVSEGTLTSLSVYTYLDNRGLRPFDKNLSVKYQNVLGGKKIEDLTKGEIATLLQDKGLSVELRSALGWAQSLNGLTMANGKDTGRALFAAIDKAGLDVRFEGILKGRRISDLSTKQISILLKSDDVSDELKTLLREISAIRKFSNKQTKLAQTTKELGRTAAYWGRRVVMKFRGTDLGDGAYAIYSAVHTVKTTVLVTKGIINYNRLMRASLRDWISRGQVGSLRYKIANTDRFKRKEAKRARKQAAARQKAEQKALKRGEKLAKKQAKTDKRNARRQKRRDRFNKRHPKTSKRINKIKKRTRKVTNRLGRVSRGFGKVSRGVRKIVGTILKPFKIVSGFIYDAKKFLTKKFILPFLKYCAIFLFAIMALQICLGFLDAGLSAVYTVLNPIGETEEKEDTGLNTAETLANYGVELCINLDSLNKYYYEYYYKDKTVIDSVKDSLKNDESYKIQINNSFYDPAANETLNLKRLGTTLNNIQTGIYYSYYDGDGNIIGFKSNAKDISAMANAWIGQDAYAKGLYKSYVEKLWNYSHAVAYSPRKQGAGDYNGKYVYACSSNEESSECFSNEYSYKCNDSGANVYETSWGHVTGVKTNIKNGNDRASGKVNGSYGDTSPTVKINYTVKDGIVEYNEYGCSQHKLTYHKGPDAKKFSGIAPVSVALKNGLSATITFYSNGDETAMSAPSGCSNWKYVTTAYKKDDGSLVTCRAYYCAGCCSDCEESKSQQVTIATKKIATHTGSVAQTISGKTYYNLGTISSCGEKETKYHGTVRSYKGKNYHVVGTSYAECLGKCHNLSSYTETSSSASTTYCTGYCKKVTKEQTCNYKISLSGITYNSKQYYGIIITNPLHGKNITVRGRTLWAYQANGLKIQVYAAAPSGWTVSKTKTIDFKSCKDNLYYASTIIDGIEYVWDVRLPASNLSKVYGSEKLLCYKATCTGHTTSTTTNTTYYYCLGHERCKGYLRDDSTKINVNYCKGYCSGHTLEHYCTGHVDLNVAVVTLFLDDDNSMAYLGVPKTVISENKAVTVHDAFKLTGQSSVEREVHSINLDELKKTDNFLYKSVGVFKQYSYTQCKLPDYSVWSKWNLALDGDSTKEFDVGNAGNPLSTIRWNESFINSSEIKNRVPDGEEETLDFVIGQYFATFSESGMWTDLNDTLWTTPNVFNIKGSYSKFAKHHYFDGFFEYSDTVSELDGKVVKNLVWHTNVDGTSVPKDSGLYARALEMLKENWKTAYKIVFPGAYNLQPADEEMKQIIKNITSCANSANRTKVNQRIDTAQKLLESIEKSESVNSLKFASEWFNEFYNASHGSNEGNSNINNALRAAKQKYAAISSDNTDIAREFRKQLGAKSFKDEYHSETSIQTAICNLCLGDLLGVGDEVYVVLYNDTEAQLYPDGIINQKRGIDYGHVIVATTNGSNDAPHLFSFTTEYINAQPELFWVYKCE